MCDWRKELGAIINGRSSATRAEQENAQFAAFLNDIVAPALRKVAAELSQYGRDISIREAPASVVLTVRKDGMEEITFRVLKRYASSGIIPYAEVRLVKGTRYVRHDTTFGDDPLAGVANVSEAEIINCFIKLYKQIT